MRACTSDRCTQGRHECPTPDACRLEAEDLSPLTPLEVMLVVAIYGSSSAFVLYALSKLMGWI
jgi:hypothetical protein